MHSGFRRWRCRPAGVRFREPQPRCRRYLRAVPVLLGMGRQMAVGGAAYRHRALRDARHDVFANWRCCGGYGGGGVVVARRG